MTLKSTLRLFYPSLLGLTLCCSNLRASEDNSTKESKSSSWSYWALGGSVTAGLVALSKRYFSSEVIEARQGESDEQQKDMPSRGSDNNTEGKGCQPSSARSALRSNPGTRLVPSLEMGGPSGEVLPLLTTRPFVPRLDLRSILEQRDNGADSDTATEDVDDEEALAYDVGMQLTDESTNTDGGDDLWQAVEDLDFAQARRALRDGQRFEHPEYVIVVLQNRRANSNRREYRQRIWRIREEVRRYHQIRLR